MYPSPQMPAYGVFVKNFVETMSKEKEVEFVQFSLIKGRKKGVRSVISYLFFFLDIIYKANFKEYDLIYVHFVKHSLLPLNCWFRKGKRKLVLNAHGTDILGQGRVSDLFRKFNRELMIKADLFVVPSEFFKSKVKMLGVKNESLWVSASGGIDPLIFYPLKGKKRNSGKIGYFGRLDDGKGLNVLFEAFKGISKEKEIYLELIGGGSLEESLKKESREGGYSNKIEFKGMLPQAQSADAIRNWDLMIFPSELEESLGLVGIEAMACGVPVIGSEIGGITSYLKNNFNGFTFEPGNADLLKEKVLGYYQLTEVEQKNLSTNALNTSKDYTIEVVSKKLSTKLNTLFND